MTGLEKMKHQILLEAQTAAEEKRAAADAQAKELITKARIEADRRRADILRKSEAEIRAYKDRVVSANDLYRRTELLSEKQALIGEVLEKAQKAFDQMDAGTYFEVMLKMIEKYAQPAAGELFFSARDLARLPSDFDEKASACAIKKGGSLVISKKGREIQNGFVLAYGGIEENCTLEAVFHARKDELSDKVHRILFS